MKNELRNIISEWNIDGSFSGVISVSASDDILYQEAFGYRNRAEELPNKPDTAFAIASGTKLFTALAVCKLIDCGLLSLENRVCDLIPCDLKSINKEITVFHLLTHTSGIGDYIDEETSSDYFDILQLYDSRPVHKWDSLNYYLPMFNELPQKFSPGERFGYSNAGFILLGLVVENVSKKIYQQYVTDNIIIPLGLSHTGFFRMNNLPGNTAIGYLYNESRDEHETNALYMPIIGGSDGGIFSCAADIIKVWQAVFANWVFSASMLEQFITPHITINEQEYCGLGVFIRQDGDKKAYYSVGGDFGVDYFSAYFPKQKTIASALGNTEMNTFPLFKRLFEVLG